MQKNIQFPPPHLSSEESKDLSSGKSIMFLLTLFPPIARWDWVGFSPAASKLGSIYHFSERNLYLNEMLTPLVLFLPSAMPAKGLAHCQKQPQVNVNGILWSISVITLWCQQRWRAWLDGHVAHFLLRNTDDRCLESLLVYSWSAGTEPKASPDKVDIRVIPVLLPSGVAAGEGAEEGVGEQTRHLLLRHGDGVGHACLEERHRLEGAQKSSQARSKSFETLKCVA